MLRGNWKIGNESIVGPDQVRYESRASVTLLDQSDQVQGRTVVTLVYDSLPAEELAHIAALLAPAIYNRTPVVVQWFDRHGAWKTSIAYAAPIRIQRRTALHAQSIEITLFLTNEPTSFVGQPPAPAPQPTQTPPPPESRFLRNEVIPNAHPAHGFSACAFVIVLTIEASVALASADVVAEIQEPPSSNVRIAATPSATVNIAVQNVGTFFESNVRIAATPSATVNVTVENIGTLFSSNARIAATPSATINIAVGNVEALFESNARIAATPSAVVSIETTDIQATFDALFGQNDELFAIRSAVVYLAFEDMSAAL